MKKKYVVNPIIIEAMLIGDDSHTDGELCEFCNGEIVEEEGAKFLVLDTVDGKVRAGSGIYVCKSPEGQLQVMPDEVFHHVYREYDEQEGLEDHHE